MKSYLLSLILSTLAMVATATDKIHVRAARQLEQGSPVFDVEGVWDLYLEMPSYDKVFGGEDFVVILGKKLSKKVTNDRLLFPEDLKITAKVLEQVEVTSTERRKLQRDLGYTWTPNKKLRMKIMGKCGDGCSADNGDRRKLMSEVDAQRAGRRLLKRYWMALGRSVDMVTDIRGMRLVATLPELGISLDIFYSPYAGQG
jgi:hypothetical protein